MWDRFDAAAVQAELKQMRDIGLNTCRSFSFIPSFMPHPPEVNPGALERLGRFLGLCDEEGVATIPSFLVGHMSGENYDFPGQEGRSPYTDPELLAWQEVLTAAVAAVGAKHSSVMAYLASNEMPLWGGRSDPATISRWAGVLRQALRREEPDRPFSLGDGVMNLKGGQNGFDPVHLHGEELIDFVGPHSYYTDADPMRQALNAEFCVRSVSHLGLPVLFEEFGCSSAQASEQNQARYFREVLHGCLSAGAAGALGWCYSDFDLVDEAPYSHHAFELGFGITRADGSEKPVCDELRTFSKLVDQIGFEGLRPSRPEAAILVPSYFNTQYPFSYEDRDRMRRVLLQAYTLCAQAGVEAELVPEDADLSRYKLIMAPSTQKLLAPTWRGLEQRAKEGATVYWSYFGGDYNFHQGAWCEAEQFQRLTGCAHRLRYACYDLPPDRLEISGPGIQIKLNTDVGEPYPRAYLPLSPGDGVQLPGAAAEARGHRDMIGLAQNKIGHGQFLFSPFPLEYYLSQQANLDGGDGTHTLYRYLARIAGLKQGVVSRNPLVQPRMVQHDDGPLLWLINHAWQTVETTVDTPGGEPLLDAGLPLEEGSNLLTLEPKQVAMYKLHG